MILLFIMVLTVGTLDDRGIWLEGQYSRTGGSYETLAACEEARANTIRSALTRTSETFISKCATGEDVVEYRVFSQAKSAPVVKKESF